MSKDASPPLQTNSANPRPEALIGTTIGGRYRVESLLGEGGMATVYLVQHTGIRKHLALKLLSAEVMKIPSLVTRFEREATTAAHLDHPNVAAASDYGRTDDGRFYLVLEYVEGHELRRVLDETGGPLPLARALFITRQIALALSRAHELGVVHRDRSHLSMFRRRSSEKTSQRRRWNDEYARQQHGAYIFSTRDGW